MKTDRELLEELIRESRENRASKVEKSFQERMRESFMDDDARGKAIQEHDERIYKILRGEA